MPAARHRASMRDHVDELGEIHGVSISWMPKGHDRWKAESFPTCRPPIALVPRIASGVDYLIALHEIGHCLSEDALRVADDSGPYAHVLCEAGAWAWACAAADRTLLAKVTDRDWALVASAIGSHIRAAAVSQPGVDGPVRH